MFKNWQIFLEESSKYSTPFMTWTPKLFLLKCCLCPSILSRKALKNIKRGATGSEGIPYWVLKSFASILSSPVCTVFNRSITECKVLRVFKQANVLPIPKTSSTPKEYRPISLLRILSKVLERLVRDQWLLPAMRGKFYPLQFAFTPNLGSGTTCFLSFIAHKILEHLDTPGAVRLLLVDFNKTVDKADHAVALHSLCKFSIPREALFGIHSFLVDRKQRVVCIGQSSSWCDITSGVPQGSVLGPLKFASIIDSLKPISTSCIYVKYADDVTALNFLRTDSDDTLQLEYNHILHWSAESRLVVNNSKTHVMNMKTSSKLACGTLHDEHGSTLEVVDNARILGIIYSSNLSWNSHIERVASLCAKKSSLLRLSSVLDALPIRLGGYIMPQFGQSSHMGTRHGVISLCYISLDSVKLKIESSRSLALLLLSAYRILLSSFVEL
jgi:hypothetical protein